MGLLAYVVVGIVLIGVGLYVKKATSGKEPTAFEKMADQHGGLAKVAKETGRAGPYSVE